MWQQSRQGDGAAGTRIRPNDLWDSMRAEGNNFLVAKVSYWLGPK